jgi:hypothetical protein
VVLRGLARRVGQRHEHFGPALPPVGHRRPDDARAPDVPVLVPQPLEDPLGRVPLLLRSGSIVYQDLLDDRLAEDK